MSAPRFLCVWYSRAVAARGDVRPAEVAERGADSFGVGLGYTVEDGAAIAALAVGGAWQDSADDINQHLVVRIA